MKDVSYITIGWDVNKYPAHMAEFYLRGWRQYQANKDELTLEWEVAQLSKWEPVAYTERVIKGLEQFGFKRSEPLLNNVFGAPAARRQ